MPESEDLRALDFNVATVIGWTHDQTCDAMPSFSTDANAALQAYEVMRERGWHLTLLVAAGQPDTGCHATLFRGPGDSGSGIIHGETVAEALCRAIVAAAGMEAVDGR